MGSIRLDGLTALVTGGGRGIGRVIATALASAGAAVAIGARTQGEIADTAREIVVAGGIARAVRCDVSSRDDVDALVAEVEHEVGPVDVLVNDAGQLGPVGPLATSDSDEWWRTLEVNLGGALHCTRAVLPGMLARRRGRIINVSSSAALAAVPGLSAYVVSKAALIRFTESVAAETKGRGVSVFTVLPGLVRTAMAAEALSCGDPAIATWFDDELRAGRDVSPDAASALVVYLASGDADVLSGRTISVKDDVARLVLDQTAPG